MSLFLPHKRPLLTFLLQETIATVLASEPEATIEEVLAAAHIMAGMKVPSQAQMLALAERLSTKEAPVEGSQSKSGGPAMGRALLDWMEQLPTDQMCLLVCDYDTERARNLYCHTDIEIAGAVFSLFMDKAWQSFRAQFEASLYGFGGSLEGGGEVPTVDVDMGDNTQVMNMLSELKAMGL